MFIVMPKIRSSLSAIAIAMVLCVAAGCSTPQVATEWTFGDSITSRVKETRLIEHVGYNLGAQHYVINPSQEDRVILAAFVEIRNHTQANMIYITIDEDNLLLRDQNDFDYRPLDPFMDATEADSASDDQASVLPFLWADGSENAPTIELHKKCDDLDCVLAGWVLFEVPRTIAPQELILEANDTVYMRFL